MRTSAHVFQEKQAGLWHLQGVCSGLLLLCVVASEVWDAETKPIEFVCSKGTRRSMNIAADMESALSNCNGSMTSPTPIRLPCNELHVSLWQNKTHQEKRGDIIASLRLLTESVKAVRVSEQLRCSASLLLRLENNINNYLLIVSHLQLGDKSKIAAHTFPVRQNKWMSCDLVLYNSPDTFLEGPAVTPALSCVPRDTRSIRTLLLSYNRLISGKLERFMVELKDRCP